MADVARLALQIDVNGAQRARQALQGLQDGSIRAQRATGQLSGALVRSSRSFKVNSQLINQAGFQVGDFATQVASGQNALVAFTQQFGQLAGFIGPAGPVLGAIVAIGGAIGIGLVNSMGDAVDATNEFQDYVDGLTDSFERLTAAQLKNAENLFYAENRQRQKQITDYREQIDGLIEQQNELNELINNPRQRALRGRATGISVSAEELRQRAQALNPEITALQAKIDSLTQSAEEDAETLDKMREGMNGITDETKEANDQVTEMLSSLKEQADTLGLNSRQIALYKANQLLANGADEEAVRLLRQKINAYYNEVDANEAATEAERQRIKMRQQMQKDIAQLDPASAEFNRYADQIDRIEEYNLSAAEKERLREEAFRQHQEKMAQIANQGGEQIADSQNQGLQLLTNYQQTALGAFGQIFGNMAEIAEKGGKDQFDTWKAMASAQAAVNSALAISNALATPPAPVGIALAGTIGALGAAQIAQIQATEYQGSYLGGGYTGDGPRSGGIDGRGGFPAILHPNETVVDHTRSQGMGMGDVNIVINNAPAGTGATARRERDGTVTIDMFQSDMANGGPMWKSIATTAGLKRVGR